MENYVVVDSDGFVVGYGSGTVPPKDAIQVDSIPPMERSYVENGVVVTLPEEPSPDHVIDKVNKVWVLDEAKLATRVERERKRLLQESDWTQLPDVPLTTKEAWADYRQTLRDITKQSGYPTNIIWPIKPI